MKDKQRTQRSRVSKCSRKASQEKQPAHQRTYLDGRTLLAPSSALVGSRCDGQPHPSRSDPRSRLAGAVALAVVDGKPLSSTNEKCLYKTRGGAGVAGGKGRQGASPLTPPPAPPHPACVQRARPGAVSVCAGPRKRAQLPPAALRLPLSSLRLPVFYLFPPQNSAAALPRLPFWPAASPAAGGR